MKNKQDVLLDAMSDIRPEFIAEADPAAPIICVHKLRRVWMIAAAILLTIATVFTSALISKKASEEPLIPVEVKDGRLLWIDSRERNQNSFLSENSALVWRWEYKEIYEKFTYMTFDDKEYGVRYCLSNATSPLTSEYIGEPLGKGVAKGHDIYEEKDYSIHCDVYEIRGLDCEEFVAVRYENDDTLFVFKNHEYMPPATLGEMLSRYNLQSYVSLSDFYYEKNNKTEKHYGLTEGSTAEIWALIAQHASTPIVSDYTYYRNKEHVSFALYSIPLGIDNLSMTVNSEGYLTTNLADYGYSFHIGVDAAKQIMDCALSHKTNSPPVNRAYIVGKIIEIGDGYFTLDDSISMKNPNEGILFTVKSDALRIRRHFEMGGIAVGSTVRLTYDGRIYADNPTVIENPLTLERCFIGGSNGDQILIPE